MADDDEWQRYTMGRILMALGGAETPDDTEAARTLYRSFTHFWPNAQDLWVAGEPEQNEIPPV